MRRSASRDTRMKKRKIWLEKAIEKLEKAGIEILWIKLIYQSKDIIPSILLKIKTKKTILVLRVYNRLNWRIYNKYYTTYKITKTIEECIKEIEGGKN